MHTFTEQLLAKREPVYGEFQNNLIPTIDNDRIMGIRIPVVRAMAKDILKQAKTDSHVAEQLQVFMKSLPHYYYDENNLHGELIAAQKDFDTVVLLLDAFLPYVDNWATCDIISPKVLKKQPESELRHILRWIETPHVYTSRFGMEMLMRDFLDGDTFKAEYLEWVACHVPSDIAGEYYVQMMQAWFFATALAKQWDAALPWLTGSSGEPRLPVWVHNKTIQKAVESYRITSEQKDFLRTLRIKRV